MPQDDREALVTRQVRGVDRHAVAGYQGQCLNNGSAHTPILRVLIDRNAQPATGNRAEVTVWRSITERSEPALGRRARYESLSPGGNS